MKNLAIDFSQVGIEEKYKPTILSNEILYEIFLQADIPTRANIVLSFNKKFYKHFEKMSLKNEKCEIAITPHCWGETSYQKINGIGVNLSLVKIEDFDTISHGYVYHELDGQKYGKEYQYTLKEESIGRIKYYRGKYKDGKLDGKFTKYDFSGKIIFECHYKSGKPVGECIFYNKYGEIEKKYQYSNMEK